MPQLPQEDDFERWRRSEAGKRARKEAEAMLAKGTTRKQIGVVIVDSGGIWIGDPCQQGSEDPTLVTLARVGDGSYPVYAEVYANGQIARIEISVSPEQGRPYRTQPPFDAPVE